MASQAVTRKRGLRRSKLVAKGGTWETISAANASAADIIHIELESGFPQERRPAAVEAACRALAEMDWSGKEAWVRFRHIDAPGTADELARVLVGRPHLVYCAKVKSPEDILKLDRTVSRLEADIGIPPGSTQIGAVIERIEALNQVEAIAAASPRMGAIMFGANDMSLDFGYRRTGIVGMDHETLYIRSRMVLAGRLAKIDVIDAAYMNRADPASGEADAEFSARMGFTGKTALSAEQIAGIHRAFVPTARELAWARAVLAAAVEENEALRLVDDDPIDDSDILRARVLIARAD
jgi:citrate lyase subunit beta / citryl-CoA lyase